MQDEAESGHELNSMEKEYKKKTTSICIQRRRVVKIFVRLEFFVSPENADEGPQILFYARHLLQ